MTWRVPPETCRANAARARAARAAIAEERAARLGELIRGGYTIQQAAWELCVSRRTADRYRNRLRRQQREA